MLSPLHLRGWSGGYQHPRWRISPVKKACDIIPCPCRFDVDEYSGHTANQRPRSFSLDQHSYETAAVPNQWYEPLATYLTVQTTEGKVLSTPIRWASGRVDVAERV